MSQLLLPANNNILFVADHIVFGVFEGEEKWALYDNTDHIFLYALDNGYRVETYEGELPEDINEFGKYLYDNGAIVPNPDWVAPPPTEEERIRALEQMLADQDALLADILLSI